MGKDGKKRKDWRKTTAYKELAKSLRENLEARGLVDQVYTDKLEEYLDFWCRRQELKADVAERGLVVLDERGRQSENRSISLEIQVSRQMLTIFTALGFKNEAERAAGSGGDDDEL